MSEKKPTWVLAVCDCCKQPVVFHRELAKPAFHVGPDVYIVIKDGGHERHWVKIPKTSPAVPGDAKIHLEI